MKRLILLSTVFLFINSCSEESSMFDPTYFGDGFKGITFTLEDGPDPLKDDPTDWCFDRPNIYNKTDDDSVIIDETTPPVISYTLYPAYPNPITVNGSTTIRYSIPESASVYIYVINNNYNKVVELINREHTAGAYEIKFNTEGLAAGVYRVIFESGYFQCKGDIWIQGTGN